MTGANGGRGLNTQPAVLAYLTSNADKHVLLDALAAATGLEPRQVQSAVYNLGRKQPEHVETVIAGQAWVWHSTPRPATGENGKRRFEELAVTRNGDILVESEDGAVYRLVEIV